MLPYKIRKPAWGSLKPKAKRSEDDVISRLGGDPNDCHTIGGNLQRAMLLDLVELRQRYFYLEFPAESSRASIPPTASASSSAAGGANRNSNPHKAQHQHSALGSSFSRLKACFREARFGAIHTRTIPPRTDRGEYVQLLYSSCFHLLEQSFKGSYGNGEPLDWENNSRPNSAFNAIYAAFVLYTLHQTNVLPKAPSPRSYTKRTKSGKLDEQSLREAWSMLAIGINTDEDKLYRRTFRSGVRVDRWNYVLLLRLRDSCLSRIDECSVADMQCTNDDDSNSTRQCHCGLARDAAHVIDKMLFNDTFFEYCEYHGPHCLEGLAGSSNFYKAHFVKPTQKSKRSKRNAKSVALPTPVSLSESKLKNIGDDDLMDDLLDMQNLSKMVESHNSNVSSIMGELFKSRQPGSSLQPKQRELVENTLRDVFEPSAKHLQMLENLNAKKDSDADVINVPNMKPNAKPLPVSKVKGPIKELLSFPESFSSALCDQIRVSLSDFREEAETIRISSVVKTKKVSMKKGVQNDNVLHPEPLAAFDDFDTGHDIGPHTTPAKRRRRKRPREPNSKSLEIQQEERKNVKRMPAKVPMEEDEVSVATGAGRNALLSLLSKAEGNKNDANKTVESVDEVSMATGAGRNALLSLLTMAESNNKPEHSEDGSVSSEDGKSELQSLITAANDDTSVVSGMGKRALQFLLTQSSNRRDKKHEGSPKPKVVAKTAKSKSAKKRKSILSEPEGSSNDRNNTFEKDDELSMATGAGRNALLSLLAMAEGNNKLTEDGSVSSEDENYELQSLMSMVHTANSTTLNDDTSVVSGMGKKALQFLLSQSTNNGGNEPRETEQAQPTRKRAPRKSPSQASSKRKAVAKTAKSKPAKKKPTLFKPDGNSNNRNNTFEKDDDSSVATGAGRNALLSLLSMAEGNNKSQLSEDGSVSSEDENYELESLMSAVHNANSSTLNDDTSVVSGMGKKALQFLLKQSTNGGNDSHESAGVKNLAGKRAPRKSPSQISSKRKAVAKGAKSTSPKRRKIRPARLAKTKATEKIHREYHGDSEHVPLSFTPSATGTSRNTLPGDSEPIEDGSVSGDNAESESQALMPATNNGNISTMNDDMSVVSGMGKKSLHFLLKQSINGTDNKQDSEDAINLDGKKGELQKKQSHYSSKNNNINSGKVKAHQLLFKQSTNRRNNKHDSEDATNLVGKRGKSQKFQSQSSSMNNYVQAAKVNAANTGNDKANTNAVSTKANAVNIAEKKVSPEEEETCSARSVPTNRSKSTKSIQREDTREVEADDETSSNISATTGLLSDEEFSVATEGAGRNALASLLSKAKHIEE